MPPVPKPKRDRTRHFLREWRKHRGYSLETASGMIGISKENLGRIERGLVPYNQDLLELAAQAYYCEVPDLLIRNPMDAQALWSLVDQLKKAEPSTRKRIEAVIETLLKTGT